MNVSTRAGAPREDRRQTILTATLELIAEGGVDSVTHRRVARHAGIPLGSTTYYFESREHLIRATFDHYLDQMRVIHDQIAIDPTESPGALVRFLMAFTTREFERRDLLLAEYEMTLFAARDPLLADALHEWYDAMTAEIAAALRSFGATEPESAARSILQLIRGHELECLTRPDAAATGFERRLTTLVDACLRPTS